MVMVAAVTTVAVGGGAVVGIRRLVAFVVVVIRVETGATAVERCAAIPGLLGSS